MLGHSRLTGAPVDTLTADGDSVAVLAGKLRQYSATVRELEDRLVQSEDLWLHRTKAAEHEMREEIKSLKGAMSLRDKDVAELERELASTKLQLAEAQAKLAGRLSPADAKDPKNDTTTSPRQHTLAAASTAPTNNPDDYVTRKRLLDFEKTLEASEVARRAAENEVERLRRQLRDLGASSASERAREAARVAELERLLERQNAKPNDISPSRKPGKPTRSPRLTMSVVFGDEVAPQPPDLAALGACLSQELALNLRGLKDDLAELKASLRSQVCHHRSVSRNGRLADPAVSPLPTDRQQPQTCPPPPPALLYRATSLPRSAVSFAVSPATSPHPLSPTSAELGDARRLHGGAPAPALQRLLAPMLTRAPSRRTQVFVASPNSRRAPRAGSFYSALRRPSSSSSSAAIAAALVHPRRHSRDDASSSTVVVSPDMTPSASVAELDAARATVGWAEAVSQRRRASNSSAGEAPLAAALQQRLLGLTDAADSDAARIAELQRRIAGLEQEVREGQRANQTNKLRSRRLGFWFSTHRAH